MTWQLLALWRWIWQRPDAVIDELIAKNTATPKPGMGSVDWHKVGRWGAQRWHQRLRAQRRTQQGSVGEWPRKVG